jgi:DNA replication protein
MKSKRLLDIVKTNDLIVPAILLANYKKLNINEKELLFLALLMSYDKPITFDPNLFSNTLGFSIPEIMELMSSLTAKKYVDMVVKKENGKMKEYVDIDSLYEKLVLMSIETEEKDPEDSEIYSIIESELGRTLSPIEYETIGGWLNANISEELIKEALKEAVLNGVHNLKYIDKILSEWSKKGYKKASDVKKKKTKEIEKVEIYEYDWLDDNE